MKVVLACDESGAKGYATQREQYPGQVGVFAGILVPENSVPQAEIMLEAAVAPFRGGLGKLHIADLPSAEKPVLRARVYDAVQQLRLPCFWYAIHVEGYHHHFRMMDQIMERAFQASRPDAPPPNQPKDEKHSLHAELFRGLYGHLICFIEENAPGEVEIEVRTDHVDRPIAKYFEREAQHLLNTEPRIETITGFDKVNQRVNKRELRFKTTWPEGLLPSTKVKSLDIKCVSDADPIVVAADVLAGSLYYHFRSRSGDALYADLNRPGALAGHPLADRFDAFRVWTPRDIADCLFCHPERLATDSSLAS